VLGPFVLGLTVPAGAKDQQLVVVRVELRHAVDVVRIGSRLGELRIVRERAADDVRFTGALPRNRSCGVGQPGGSAHAEVNHAGGPLVNAGRLIRTRKPPRSSQCGDLESG
jgi:hypothetical protein